MLGFGVVFTAIAVVGVRSTWYKELQYKDVWTTKDSVKSLAIVLAMILALIMFVGTIPNLFMALMESV